MRMSAKSAEPIFRPDAANGRSEPNVTDASWQTIFGVGEMQTFATLCHLPAKRDKLVAIRIQLNLSMLRDMQ